MKEREYRYSKLRAPTEDEEREHAIHDLETKVRVLQHEVDALRAVTRTVARVVRPYVERKER